MHALAPLQELLVIILGLEIENSNERIIGVNETSTQPVEGNVKNSKQPKHGEMYNMKCVVSYHTTSSDNP